MLSKLHKVLEKQLKTATCINQVLWFIINKKAYWVTKNEDFFENIVLSYNFVIKNNGKYCMIF